MIINILICVLSLSVFMLLLIGMAYFITCVIIDIMIRFRYGVHKHEYKKHTSESRVITYSMRSGVCETTYQCEVCTICGKQRVVTVSKSILK